MHLFNFITTPNYTSPPSLHIGHSFFDSYDFMVYNINDTGGRDQMGEIFMVSNSIFLCEDIAYTFVLDKANSKCLGMPLEAGVYLS